MKTSVLILLAAILPFLSAGQSPSPEPSPPAVPLASAPLRVRLADLGTALSNEGFKMRDRIWSGRVEAGQPQRLAVNLFRGNHYWFCAAVEPTDGKAKLTVFGPDGRAVESVDHQEPGLAAAGVTAETTGQYFLQVETAEGPASDFCLLYLFK
jgi:hypothetical protein